MRKTKLDQPEFEERVLNLFAAPARKPLSDVEIGRRLAVRGGARKHLRSALERMARQGKIVRLRGNQYSVGTDADLVPGKIDVLRSGNGIVQPADGSAEIFVPREDMGTALPSDAVVVRLDPETAARRTGRVIRILERSRRAISGTLKATPKFHYVVPIDPAYNQDFYVADTKGARVDDRVVIQFTEWPNRHVSPEAEIIEVIGPASNPSLDTLTIIRHCALRDVFPPEVMREAERAPARMEDSGARRDLRDCFVFTVDPLTSRDFDDALSIASDNRGRTVLGVHIADVAHFVEMGGAMDREARLRGNSVYLPDRVLPMLPEQLSNGLCSLRPDEDRLAFSVLMTFDDGGALLSAEFCRSLIRSRLRLNYDQALAVLQAPDENGRPELGLAPAQHAVIKRVHRLAQRLRARRLAQYALDLDMPDYEVIMGADGMIADIRRNVNDISHQMIEECMIAANEAVDRELSRRGYALLHRVHEPPALEKIEQLRAQLEEMGLHPGDLAHRRNMADFLQNTRKHPFAYDIMLAVLKSMKRAVYTPEALKHYGLAKSYYAHFTSPIRRYPDLVAHRILAAALAGAKNPYTPADLKMLGASCSRTEQVAETAEKNLLDIKKYRFLEQQLLQKKPRVYEAVIVRVTNFGLFVELTQLQLQGLVHISALSREFVRFDAERRVLHAGVNRYGVAGRIEVVIARVDFEKRQLDFVPASTPHAGAAPVALRKKTSVRQAPRAGGRKRRR